MNARIGISSSSHAHNLSAKKYSSIPGPQCCPSCAENQSIDFPGGIDDSEVDEELLDEWDELTEREYELEKILEGIVDAVHEKHLDIKFARAVILDIRRINARTPLRRQLTLLRMKEHAGKMVEIADREITLAQFPFKKELDEIRRLISINEGKIKEQVRKRRATVFEELSAKRTSIS